VKTLPSYQGAKRRRRKLLKDKKIEILYPQVVSDNIGNQVTGWEKMTVSPLWAYFRQLGGDEYYTARAQQVEEEVVFVINWRDDISVINRVVYKGNQYDIKRVDTYEGYKGDLKLYCKLV